MSRGGEGGGAYNPRPPLLLLVRHWLFNKMRIYSQLKGYINLKLYGSINLVIYYIYLNTSQPILHGTKN